MLLWIRGSPIHNARGTPRGTNMTEKRAEYVPTSPSKKAWNQLRRNRGAMIGMAVIICLFLIAILAPYLTPYDPIQQDRANSWREPDQEYRLGTDMFGRDVLTRIIFGARISLLVGFVSISVALVGGLFLGLVSAFYRGTVEMVVNGITEVMLAFPGILLAMIMVAVLGPSLFNLMIAVGISWMPRYTRLVRGTALSIMQEGYVDAARSSGAGDMRIMVKHVLPNVMGPILVMSTMGVGTAILVAAALSFLGLGAQPPTPEWGAMLSSGRNHMLHAPWLTTYPGVAIVITVLSINLFGDGVRDALDPRMLG